MLIYGSREWLKNREKIKHGDNLLISFVLNSKHRRHVHEASQFSENYEICAISLPLSCV